MKLFFGLVFILALFFSNGMYAQANDLMIVDYVDWDPGNGVGTTVYNPTTDTIDLSKYVISYYNNGSTSPSASQSLSGKIYPFTSIVIGNTEYCSTYCSCNISNSSSGVNGNDAVALLKSGSFVDMVGLVGSNTFWKVGGVANAFLHHRITRDSVNCTRYTSTNGTSSNSWPNSSSTNMTGWSVSNPSCLSTSSFNLSIPTIVKPQKDTTVCAGTTVNFAAPVATTWAKRNGSLKTYSSAKTLQITFSNAETDTIIVGSGDCAHSVIVKVNPNPAPQITGNKKLSLCANSKDTLFVVKNIIGIHSWKKYGNHTGSIIKGSSSQDSLHVTLGTNIGTDTFVVSDKSGACTGYDTLYLTINPQPAPKIKGNKKLSLCASGKDTFFLVQNTIGTVLWKQLTNNTGTSIKGLSNHDTLKVTLGVNTGTDIFLVSDKSGACIGYDTLYLTINPEPAPKIKGNKKLSLCASGKDTLFVVQNIIGSVLWKQLTNNTGTSVKGLSNHDTLKVTLGTNAGTDAFIVSDKSGSCAGFDTLYLTINPTPAPLIKGSKNVGLCASSKDTFFIAQNVTGKPNWIKLTRNTGTIITGSATGDSVYLQPGILSGTDIFVIIDKLNNCTGTDTLRITILPAPAVSGYIDTTICYGDTIQFDKTGGIKYSWSPSTRLDNPLISNPHAFPLITTKYKVLVTNNSGCSIPDSVLVTVNPKINANAGIDQTICKGDSIQLHANGGLAYSWSPKTGLNKTDIPDPYTRPLSTMSYTLKASSGKCFAFDTVRVNVLSTPVADGGIDDTICSGEVLTLISQPAASYQWNTGATSQSIIVSPSNTHTYGLVVGNGTCNSKADSIKVTVLPRPTASFSVDSAEGSLPLAVNFTNNSSGGSAFHWYFGDGSQSDLEHPGHTYTKIGTYNPKLIVENTNGCKDSFIFTDIKIIGPDIKWFIPNVFTPDLNGINETFEITGTGISNIHGLIFNRWGEELYSFEEPGGNAWWDGTYRGIKVADGVYYYQVTINDVLGRKHYASGTLTVMR